MVHVPAVLPFPAPLESQHVVADVVQQAPLDAQLAHGNCAGINGALVEVTKHMPQPVETLSKEAWQKFRQVLEDHGLDPDAGDKIECGQLRMGYKPWQVCQELDRSCSRAVVETKTHEARMLDMEEAMRKDNIQLAKCTAELATMHAKVLWGALTD